MKTFIIAVSLGIFCFTSVYADIIYKKNGEKIEGVITDKNTQGQIGIKTGNKQFYVLKDEVEKIEYSQKQQEEEGPNLALIISITACCLITFLLVMAGRSI